MTQTTNPHITIPRKTGRMIDNKEDIIMVEEMRTTQRKKTNKTDTETEIKKDITTGKTIKTTTSPNSTALVTLQRKLKKSRPQQATLQAAKQALQRVMLLIDQNDS